MPVTKTADRDTLLRVAMAYRRARQFRRALDVCGAILAEQPEDFDALTAAGLAHEGLEDYGTAQAFHERALAVRPWSGIAHYYLADVHRQRGDLAAAEAHARKAVERDPREPIYWYLLGIVCYGRGDDAEAGRCADRMLELGGDPSYALFLKAMALPLHPRASLRQKIAFYLQALEHDPACPYTHRNVASVYEMLGDLPGAEEHAAQAVALRPCERNFRSLLESIRRRREGAEAQRRAEEEEMRRLEELWMRNPNPP